MSKRRSRKIDTTLLALVSSQTVGPDASEVGFAFRSAPLEPEDSGWNFWSGEEDEGFSEDPKNFFRYQIRELLDANPSLSEIIDEKVGTAWAKDPDTEEWSPVEDDGDDEGEEEEE